MQNKSIVTRWHKLPKRFIFCSLNNTNTWIIRWNQQYCFEKVLNPTMKVSDSAWGRDFTPRETVQANKHRDKQRWNAAGPVLLDAVLLRHRSIVLLTAAVKHQGVFETGLWHPFVRLVRVQAWVGRESHQSFISLLHLLFKLHAIKWKARIQRWNIWTSSEVPRVASALLAAYTVD